MPLLPALIAILVLALAGGFYWLGTPHQAERSAQVQPTPPKILPLETSAPPMDAADAAELAAEQAIAAAARGQIQSRDADAADVDARADGTPAP